jgi:magnesium chelatase subunit H
MSLFSRKPRKDAGLVRDVPVSVVILTLDAHFADAFERARAMLRDELPRLELSMYLAAEWQEDPAVAERACAAVARANIILCGQLFTEELARAVLPAVAARRDAADAVACLLCAPELSKLTKLGSFEPGKQEGGAFSPMALLRKFRGGRNDGKSSGERQMAVLRNLSTFLKFIPGGAQDLRAFFLCMQYWLAGTDGNMANLVRVVIDRYADGPRKRLRGQLSAGEPERYPETGCYHPELKGRGITERVADLPARGTRGTVGILLGRSYLLAGNTQHYDAVIRALEAKGLRTIPAYASGLDARPAIETFFRDGTGRTTIDAMVSLTGFSLVGGPAYNDAAAAQAVLQTLDVPYLSMQSLEFQTIDEWQKDARGLNPLQATLQVAIPELDGAIAPIVFGGKGTSADGGASASTPIPERVTMIAERVSRLVALRRSPRADRKVAIILFNFPPNAGNTGSAAYLAVMPSLQRTLAALKEAGYTVDLPSGTDELRERVCDGNRERFGAPANVFARVPTDEHVRREPYLAEIEKVWGPAPGKQLTDGQSLFVMGERFGNVFVGVQPAFGWEGDPMRLLFEGNFAPTHAMMTFYRWLDQDFGADVVLHYGTHGALEFLPGKQAGLSGSCWPERVIGTLPNVYLYASNNSSEGTLAKRRGGATLVSYLTPPIANAGLYKGLAECKGSLDSARKAPTVAERLDASRLVQEQAARLDLCAASPAWTEESCDGALAEVQSRLLELEYALIPMGLHVVGEPMTPAERISTLMAMAEAGRPDKELPPISEIAGPDAALAAVTALVEQGSASRVSTSQARLGEWVRELERTDVALREDHEISGILRALDARYVPPVPGGDLLRSPEVVPTGRNLYGFDPYRVPSAFAMRDGLTRAALLVERYQNDHDGATPETIAFVLWGTDNMKSEGAPIAQVLALLGAAPRFDAVGRLCGARLIPLDTLGRPRIDVVLTLSGIFRDLLPLQVKLLAEACFLAASADEPIEQNFVRKHALETVAATGVSLAEAALRVFSNADGAYGSNVNLLVETGAFQNEDELADQFVARKSFAYGVSGRPVAAPALMKRALAGTSMAFQNLDSVELGTTDIDQYVESLGGMSRVIAKEQGAPPPTYLGDHTGREGKVRSLREQVALETRTRMLNPKWFEAQLVNGYEGVRNLSGHVTTTFGWSATGGVEAVPQWVYQDIGETFVLDAAMRERLAQLNPQAALGMSQRLLEATNRGYWTPDADTLDRLKEATAELEDRLEGVYVTR